MGGYQALVCTCYTEAARIAQPACLGGLATACWAASLIGRDHSRTVHGYAGGVARATSAVHLTWLVRLVHASAVDAASKVLHWLANVAFKGREGRTKLRVPYIALLGRIIAW